MTSVLRWRKKAASAAYGILKLKPWEFDRLTFFDFYDMLGAWKEAKESERWEQAYWIVNLMNPHLKRPIKPDVLMKPFTSPKTSAETAAERAEFFRSFNKQRKEAGRSGNDKESIRRDRGEH